MTETSLSYTTDRMPSHTVLVISKDNKRCNICLRSIHSAKVPTLSKAFTIIMLFGCLSLTLSAQEQKNSGDEAFSQGLNRTNVGSSVLTHQQDAESLSFALPQNAEHWSCRHLSLELGLGTARDLYRDEGSSPLSYNGLATVPDWRLTLNLGTWDFSLLSRSTLGVYRNALRNGFALDAAAYNHFLDIKAMKRVEDKHLWLGASISDILSVKYNVHHENASVGVTDFVALGLHLRAALSYSQLQQFFIHRSRPSRCWFVGEVSLLPMSLVLRPGYTFIDNYAGANSLFSTFGSSYNWHLRAFAGITTDAGVQWQMRNLRRLSLSYQWAYLNSGAGVTGWKYQSAIHCLRLSFTFPLKELNTLTPSSTTADLITH